MIYLDFISIFLTKNLVNIDKVCTFVMLVNYYYIFWFKKSAGNGAFFIKIIKKGYS
jgi:hypothetical protein